MAECVARLGCEISSDEEVLALQQLHSALSALNNTPEQSLEDVTEHIELFGI